MLESNSDERHDVQAMIAWEQGELGDEARNELFQSLVNSGLAWQLQGMYGREAARLIEEGEINGPE